MNNTESKRYIQLGQIVKPHGLWGEVKIILYNSSSKTLQSDMIARLECDGGKERDVRIAKVRYTPKAVIVLFEEFGTIEDAESVVGCKLSVERSLLPELSESDYYLIDLIDFSVRDELGENIGSVKDILILPANDVLVVKCRDKEIMIPIVDEFIKLIDFEKKIMTVNLVEGLSAI